MRDGGRQRARKRKVGYGMDAAENAHHAREYSDFLGIVPMDHHWYKKTNISLWLLTWLTSIVDYTACYD